MPRRTTKAPNSAEFDLYEMLLVAGDLYADLMQFHDRQVEVLFLDGEGSELAHTMWRYDLHTRREALAARVQNVLSLMRAAGIVPPENGLIDQAIEDTGSSECCEAVALFKGLLAVRLADGECHRRIRKSSVVVAPSKEVEPEEAEAA